jgi:hypothetical protein
MTRGHEMLFSILQIHPLSINSYASNDYYNLYLYYNNLTRCYNYLDSFTINCIIFHNFNYNSVIVYCVLVLYIDCAHSICLFVHILKLY